MEKLTEKPLTVEEATEADYEAIVDLRQAAFPHLRRELSSIEEEDSDPNNRLIVLRVGDTIIASGRLEKKFDEGHYQLKRVVVSPDHEGNGYGSTLVASLERLAQEESSGYEQITIRLYCQESNLEFYKNLGYLLDSKKRPFNIGDNLYFNLIKVIQINR